MDNGSSLEVVTASRRPEAPSSSSPPDYRVAGAEWCRVRRRASLSATIAWHQTCHVGSPTPECLISVAASARLQICHVGSPTPGLLNPLIASARLQTCHVAPSTPMCD